MRYSTDAEAIVRYDSRDKSVGVRHLLGSLLIPRDTDPTNSDKFLVDAGVDLNRIVEVLLRALNRWNLGDDLEAWRNVLHVTDDVQDRRSPATCPTSSRAMTYRDYARSRGDGLPGRRLERRASALDRSCSASGDPAKSFFMQKMKERMREIARPGAQSEGAAPNSATTRTSCRSSSTPGTTSRAICGRAWSSISSRTSGARRRRRGESRGAEAKTFRRTPPGEVLRRDGAPADRRAGSVERDELKKEQSATRWSEAANLTHTPEAERAAQAARSEAEAKAEQKRVRRPVRRCSLPSLRVAEAVRAEVKPPSSGSSASEMRSSRRPPTYRWRDRRRAWSYRTTIREGWRLVVTGDRGGWMLLALVLAVPVTVGAIAWGTAYVLLRAERSAACPMRWDRISTLSDWQHQPSRPGSAQTQACSRCSTPLRQAERPKRKGSTRGRSGAARRQQAGCCPRGRSRDGNGKRLPRRADVEATEKGVEAERLPRAARDRQRQRSTTCEKDRRP